MAGFWHLSHHQMRDMNGRIYDGAKAYFTEADTLLPITTYQDYGLGTPHPNPVQANAYGIFPPVFFDEADGFYRQRITSKGGVLIPGTDVGTLPIIGPGEGGGGSEVPVDANALLKTGDPLWVPVTGTRAGFVRSNGRTIGSATSGATERANADTEALFTYLYGTYSDSICPVNGGRGANAATDFAANKYIGLLDLRGRAPFGLDDMGNTAASRLSGITFANGDATTAASTGGTSTHTLTIPQIPSITPAGTVTVTSTVSNVLQSSGPTDNWTSAPGAESFNDQTRSAITSTGTLNGTPFGGGAAHPNMNPFMLGTWYMKL